MTVVNWRNQWLPRRGSQFGRRRRVVWGPKLPVMTRRMFRYEVPVDGKVHEHGLNHHPAAVAARLVMVDSGHGFGDEYGHLVEFWAEYTDGAPLSARTFQVFGTGHQVPDSARWIGTCARTTDGLVWHLFEV